MTIENNTPFALNILMASIMLLAYVGMHKTPNRPRCTRVLGWCMVASMFACVFDALASLSFAPAIPPIVQEAVMVGYWLSANVIVILFLWYSYAYVTERGETAIWKYYVSTAVLTCTGVAVVALCLTGRMYTIENDVVTDMGHKPLWITLTNLAAVVFLLLLSIRKRVALGKSVAKMVAVFGTIPFLPRLAAGVTGWHDYTYVGIGVAMLSAYIYIDIKAAAERDQQHRKELEKVTEEALIANRAKTSFLFNMSHDIRTPMNAIIGFTSLLRRYQDDPVRRGDYLDKIESSSNVLLSIINNVLEMARIEKGTMALEEKAVDLVESANQLATTMRDMMKEKGVRLTTETEVKHRYVMQDPTKTMQVFNNILSNAYKYTEAGGSVHVEMRELPSDDPETALIRTTVTDTGIGMSEDFLPHLFEEFSRENNTTANKIEGTGLGMPIVKRLVEMMHGTIEVKSKKGVGTTFVVTLPHKIAEKEEARSTEKTQLSLSALRGKRLLLAEDNELNAEISMEILRENGFVMERASDGQECVEMMEKAEAGYYAAILMDIQMPRMNGYEATRAIRFMADPKKAGVPIIAMTANAFEEDMRRSKEAGMNAHVAKPISQAALTRALMENLKEQE